MTIAVLFRRTGCLVVGLLSSLAAGEAALPEAALPDRVEFNRDVRPILSDTCFHCHGPDKSHRKAKLRLDVREDAITAKAFVPGKSAESELIKRLHETDPDEIMPPPEAHKTLTKRQKDLLAKWIDQGAAYQLHWSYEKPVKAAVPAGASAIDVLVQQQLTAVGLKPSAEADRRTLIRRLYSDLIGLPPTPEQVAAFVADPSPDAYEKLVDRLLADPHYGERMAIGWLDVVRFADTIGYHSDNPRNIWPYRDWVINAFNSNKRFDRFTIEQVAGDLLPDANQETRVGSAFNRLLLSTEEGGAQPKDYESRMLTDRVRAVGAAWMGQTTGCANCHDHKFDPFTQHDFFALGAFFADIKEAILGRREDGMMVLSDSDQMRHDELTKQVGDLQAEFAKPRPDLAESQATWEKQALLALSEQGSWQALTPASAKAQKKNINLKIDGTIVHATIDDKRATRKESDGTDAYLITATVPAGVNGFRLDALKEKSNGIGLAGNQNFVLNEIVVTTADNKPLKLAHASATFEQGGFSAAGAIDGNLTERNNGWAVMGGQATNQSLYLELAEPTAAEAVLTFTLTSVWGENHCLAHVRLNATAAPKPIRAPGVAQPLKDVAEILALAPDKRSKEQADKLHATFKQSAPELNDLRTRLAAAEKAKVDFLAAAPKCLVSISDTNKRTVRILPRGNWMIETGEIVKPALPGYLAKAPADGKELNRLDLAQWLVSRDNPLTARTVMNRLWKQFFGIGLSKVLDDLGAQGEPPANPALLDWLACEFMDSGWDFKRMVRTIVTSRTYRQVSTSTPALQAADPYNRLCARQSAFRLDAELVRDNALTIAGLLVPTIGGPSVKPYQPDGYWENLNFPQRTYPADTGPAQYRRGLYTWWQRSFVHPSMLAFDAPTREECAADRTRSNIPQQALALLNDPSYVEAARVFAARILASGMATPEQRIAWAWQQALQRDPRADETKTLQSVLSERLAAYQADKGAAAALLKVGISSIPEKLDQSELAAWTHVARILLNLHETITRE
jgi:Protein of unknown function (DUF1553)/Protein of unknown function (DUF1549)/Planctomycete cytochrome C